MSLSPHESNRARHWVCAFQIAERRHQLGLTQQDVVGRLAVLGVSATNRTLSAMEHGQGIDVGRMPELAVALECSVTYLLGLTTNPQRWMPDDSPEPAGAWYHGLWRAGGDPDDGGRDLPAHLTKNQRASLRRFTDHDSGAPDPLPRRRIRRA